MNLNEILKIVITICAPIFTAGCCYGARVVAASLLAKTQNDLAQRCITEIATAVENAVRATNQTFVDNLKEQDEFDSDAAKMAFEQALSACKDSLSYTAQSWLDSITDDTESYLTTLIESQVRAQKVYL